MHIDLRSSDIYWADLWECSLFDAWKPFEESFTMTTSFWNFIRQLFASIDLRDFCAVAVDSRIRK